MSNPRDTKKNRKPRRKHERSTSTSVLDIGLLAASHRETWQRFVRYMAEAGECPPELLQELLAVDDLEGWQRRSFSAFIGLNPDDGMEAHYRLARFIGAGITRQFPPNHPTALLEKYKVACEDVAIDTTRRTRDLAREIERAGDSKEHRVLFGRALLLLARRLSEDGDHEAALAEAIRAEEVFTRVDAVDWTTRAMRARAGALFRLRKIDEAMAAMEAVFALPRAPFCGEGAHRLSTPADPIEAALMEAQRLAQSISRNETEYVRTLERLGRRVDQASLKEAGEVGEEELPRQFR